MSKPPFRADEIGEIVLVHGFEEIHRHFEGCERELPALRGAVREQVERGRRGFVFDLRSAEPIAACPVVKWGAMYWAVVPLKRRLAAGMVKLVVAL